MHHSTLIYTVLSRGVIICNYSLFPIFYLSGGDHNKAHQDASQSKDEVNSRETLTSSLQPP